MALDDAFWSELGALITSLQPGQGVELPPRLTSSDVAYRIRLVFPGYLMVKREGHTFVLRPLDVEAPPDGALGLFGRARVREEKIVQLVNSGRVRKLDDLGEELGVSRERARQLLRRLGLRLPRGAGVETECAGCGSTFFRPAAKRQRAQEPAMCPSCLSRSTTIVSLRCLRCRSDFELPQPEVANLVAPFCPTCWDALSPKEKDSWKPPRPRRKLRPGVDVGTGRGASGVAR